MLNATDLATVWGEDETIGWVYQFFNSADERKREDARGKPGTAQQPRAGRSQPVLHALAMSSSSSSTTRLAGRGSRCTAMKAVSPSDAATLFESEEEATRSRPRKDPRDLRVLDPACGSGHFLLYCFDLLLAIYEEAWEAKAPRAR